MPSRTGFHDGEVAMHQILKVQHGGNPTAPGLPVPYAMRVMQSPLVAVGTLDKDGQPWTTIWGGQRGFAQPAAKGVLVLNSVVDRTFDPVFGAFWDGYTDGGMVDGGKLMSGLSIDLETRDRVKLAGKMLGGVQDDEENSAQVVMEVSESIGNCPKYLNKKDITPHGVEGAKLEASGLPLTEAAVDLVGRADLFFLSSTSEEAMDTNHRGGPPGFMRVLRNEDGVVELVYPEYSGNRLYQTLGNLKVNSRVGVAVPDFATGDVLYLTGRTKILVGEEASEVMDRTKLAVKITVTDARYVTAGLPFRGSVVDYSPYNPPVRQLTTEHAPEVSQPTKRLTATLTGREVLTPTINRFRFGLPAEEGDEWWRAGQHVTLDFADELDMGYAHMNDSDPQSLNDDYVRTFTVSNAPGSTTADGQRILEITARRNGPVTKLLWSQPLRARLEAPVVGFGGEERFQIGEGSVFVAGGVGITPLLAQAKGLLEEGGSMTVLWSLRREDLRLALDTFERIQGLAGLTRLFVTGDEDGDDEDARRLREMGAEVETRRMEGGDVAGLKGTGRKFYLCASKPLLARLTAWLEGEDMVWEDFGY